MQNYNSKLKNLKKLLENSIVFLATANKVGNPNIAAAEVNKITADWEIIITNNQLRKTIKNIIATKKAAILFTDNKKIWWRIYGKASYDRKGKWFNFVKNLKTNRKWSPKGVLIIKIQEIDDIDNGKIIYASKPHH